MFIADDVTVEGFYVESLGPVEDEYLPFVPLRVLFGRSGAGKSSILAGLTQACFGLHALSRRRIPTGRSGLILKLDGDEPIALHGLEAFEIGRASCRERV